MLRQSTTHEIRVEKGENAMLSLVVCADPRPQVVAWEWGSYRLEAGSEHGEYRRRSSKQQASKQAVLVG